MNGKFFRITLSFIAVFLLINIGWNFFTGEENQWISLTSKSILKGIFTGTLFSFWKSSEETHKK